MNKPIRAFLFALALVLAGAALLQLSVREAGAQAGGLLSAKEPNQVFLYEVYDNAAALDSHRQTAHFKIGRTSKEKAP